MPRNRSSPVAFFPCFLFLFTGAELAETYDLVIANGRVMDPETNMDAVRNIGIRGGRITKITHERINCEQRIDAAGLIVAPGLIDTRFHWTRPIGYKLALRDGVTTAMDLIDIRRR